MEALEVRLEEVERDVRQVREDVNKINYDLTLLTKRQEDNSVALTNLQSCINSNNSKQFELFTELITKVDQVGEKCNKSDKKLTFVKGSLLALFASMFGGGTVAATAGNEGVIAFLELVAKAFL